MRCPACQSLNNTVVDSRLNKEGNSTRRRRNCDNCQHRFTTYERVEETSLMVVKKDGRREPFDRQKLLNGLLRACEKCAVSVKFSDTGGTLLTLEVSSRIIDMISSPDERQLYILTEDGRVIKSGLHSFEYGR